MVVVTGREPDPESAVLTSLHLPQWQRGLALGRALVRRGKTEQEVVQALLDSCPTPPHPSIAAWWERCVTELARLAARMEGA